MWLVWPKRLLMKYALSLHIRNGPKLPISTRTGNPYITVIPVPAGSESEREKITSRHECDITALADL